MTNDTYTVVVKIKRVQLRQSIVPLDSMPGVFFTTEPILQRATMKTISEIALQTAFSQIEISNSQKIDFISASVSL